MSGFWTEIDRRLGLGEWIGACRAHRVPGKASWLKVWACVMVFAVIVQAVTGFFLWMYYSPGAQSAWESVYYVQNQVAGGWLLRAVHHYSAHVLLAAVILYVLQTVLTAAYRAPRELVFWAALGVGCFALGTIVTGDLLYWDQNGYTSTKVRTSFLNLLPGVGQSLLALATGGGSDLGNLTLTRFFALHVGLLGGGTIALALAHAYLTRRADRLEAEGAASEPWWPNQAWISAVACLAFIAIVFALSLRHGATGPHRGVFHGSPADPSGSFDAARPEWMLVGVYELSHLFPPSLSIVPIFIVPGAVLAFFLLMPWIGDRPGGRLVNMAGALGLLAIVVGLTCFSYYKDAVNEPHQKAWAAERELALRVRQLAEAKGIPPSGALALLREDPKVQGPLLFAQHCASCHHFSAPDGKAILAEKSSAPEMYEFAARKWVSGFFHVKTITGPDYFGNTAFRNGEMVGAVKDWWKEAGDDQEAVAELTKELEAVAAALSAEAQLPAQRKADQRDKELIAAGLKSIEVMCVDCHRFHKAKGGGAPDLTGYGSKEWLHGIIANPADPRFYGKSNDRMPAYREILAAREIDLLADWLRGEWFEPPAE